MIINAIKTERVTTGSVNLLDLIASSVKELHENDILVITSKVVSLCEGSTVPIEGTDKQELINQQADLYFPSHSGAFNINFTITGHHLIASAGIDESNGDGVYVLWPRGPQTTANQVRHFLQQHYGVEHIGVIITDSTNRPMQRGVIGIPLAHSGFDAIRRYAGEPDLFGRTIKVSTANISGGLSAAAVVAMGEGDEQTPLCRISDATFVTFQDRDPSDEELAEINIQLQDDLFAPFLTAVDWRTTNKS